MDQDKLTHEFRNVTSEDEPSTPNIRPQRTGTRSMKAKEIYGTSRDEHCRKLDAAWRNVDTALHGCHALRKDSLAVPQRSYVQVMSATSMSPQDTLLFSFVLCVSQSRIMLQTIGTDFEGRRGGRIRPPSSKFLLPCVHSQRSLPTFKVYLKCLSER